MKERNKLLFMLVVFAVCWFLPVSSGRFIVAVGEGLRLLKWYAQEHVLLCLVPAFFIAGAIGVFVSQGSVMKFIGSSASKLIAYPVAAVSGVILAVCSCTVLPIFAGIYKRGAGLGPASAFLYSGPAINVLAIILTARVLGMELGFARAIGAVVFSILIGLLMHLFFRREETEREGEGIIVISDEKIGRKLWQDGLFFAVMIGILIFANWSKPVGVDAGFLAAIYSVKWIITGVFVVMLAGFVRYWFTQDELTEWTGSSWTFAKQIMPLLFVGVLMAGFLLGGPTGGRGVIPYEWVSSMIGGNSVGANLFASVAGAFMYFATLTEVPILKGLLNAGMGKGPALALLLAGPALSLPNMLIIRNVLGSVKTLVFVGLVVVLSTLAGLLYGKIF